MGKSLSKPIAKHDETPPDFISKDVAIPTATKTNQSGKTPSSDVIRMDQSEASNDNSVLTRFRSLRRSISSLLFKDSEGTKVLKDNEDTKDKFSRQASSASTSEDRKRKGDQQVEGHFKVFKLDGNCVDKNLEMQMSVESREALEEPVDTVEVNYLDFPFLIDDDTVEFFHKSLVMLVMRGLPGSGKSTVVRAIKQKYPQAVSCSADDYFYQNGVYEFQKEKIKDAHAYCQQKTEEHCKQLTRLLIVDNTHVQRWEAGPYFKMANKYRYLVVLVEPKTPWRLDVDELFSRNSHNVNRNTVKQRAELYRKNVVTPYYFGWFLNLADSKILIESPQAWLKKCLSNCQDFLDDFQYFSNCYDFKSMLNYFDRDSVHGMAKNVCHCTAKFCGKEGKEYASKQQIVDNLGKVTSLVITGFTITPRTIGARVKLNDDQKLLYAQNDNKEEAPPNQNSFAKPQHQNTNKQNYQNKKNVQNGHNTVEDDDPMELEESAHLFGAISATKPSLKTRKSTKNRETGGLSSIFGRRAHITLGCSAGVKPVQTGLDTIDIAIKEALEAGDTENKDSEEVSNDDMEASEEVLVETGVVFPQYKVPGGVLTNYGEGSWLFNLDKHIVVDAMFTGGW